MELVVEIGNRERRVEVREGGASLELVVDGRAFHIDWADAPGGGRSLLVDGRQHEISVLGGDPAYRVSGPWGVTEVVVLDALTHLARHVHVEQVGAGPQRVMAYMPGRVVSVLVEEGAAVAAGQGILILEAMKMENEIRAERAGVVSAILVAPGDAVEGGDPLYELGDGTGSS